MFDQNDHPKKHLLPKGWRKTFLQSLAQTGVISFSAKEAGVGVKTIERHRKKDPRFNAACEEAIEESCDVLEMVARKRAVDHSDTLLIFLLKGNRPEKYRDNYTPPPAGTDPRSGKVRRFLEDDDSGNEASTEG